MVCWTLRNCERVESLREAFVAAEDEAIVQVVQKFGGRVKLIKGAFRSGSDRIAEAVREMKSPAYVNVQADEPLFEPDIINRALSLLEERPDFDITTIVRPIKNFAEYIEPNSVKVVVDNNKRCLYFSRSPIPARHPGQASDILESEYTFLHHIGIYCFRAEALREFATHPPSKLEQCEGLEQLRVLEYGGRIGAIEVESAGPGINTIEDIKLAEKYIKDNGISFT